MPRTRGTRRLRVFDVIVSSPALDFVLLDVNASGIGIETRNPLQIGGDYPFRFQQGEESVDLEARVRWCKLHRTFQVAPGEVQCLYRAGLALVGAEGESQSHDSIFA
jgi:hypothetical protein